MDAFQFSPESDKVIKIGNSRLNVVGVVENFNYSSLAKEVAPTLIFHRTAQHPVHTYITCKVEMKDISSHLFRMEQMWNELGATKPFTYSFMDERVSTLYKAEQRYVGLVSMLSFLSILITCMGLYGLTLFVIEKRRKEISIRKILGSNVPRILRLIFADFYKWVILAFIISVPFIVYVMNDWLSNYHYRISISWQSFSFTLFLISLLVIITVTHQTTRAALSNPVKYLKNE